MIKRKTREIDIIITTGGTGGHIFPAISLYQCIKKENENYKILVITDRQSYKQKLFNVDRIKAIRCGKIAGVGIFSYVYSIFQTGIGVLQSFVIMITNRPKVVVGFGGFASVPALVVAVVLRIPIVIHEQNAVMGKANKLFVGVAKRVALNFEIAGCTSSKFKQVGMPVREVFLKYRENNVNKTINKDKIQVLVVGGSGGARIFSEVIPESFSKLSLELQSKFEVQQQCRSELVMFTQLEWQKASRVKISLSNFYNNIADIMNNADLIISRAGASSIAEITTLGRAALYVPISKSIMGHQVKNAKSVEKHGAGFIMLEKEFNSKNVSNFLINFYNNVHEMEVVAKNARKLAKPESTVELKQIVQEVINEYANKKSISNR